MAILTPDKITTLGGVTVKEYLLTKHNPNHIDMPTAQLTGKVLGVTIHNTDRIKTAAGTTPAEQYARATVNGNMKTVRVHYYVDSTCAWQNLPLSLSGWHAADGSGNGNRRTIAIECIMNGSGDAADKRAEENAVRLAAALLKQYGLGINHLYTHTHWLNVRDGKRGTVDQLNTMYNRYKMCPAYILPHWTAFKAKVQKYMREGTNMAQKPSTANTGSTGAPAIRYDWKKGQKVQLYKGKTQIFASESAKTPSSYLCPGTYYIYDGIACKNGRYRITTTAGNCGKTPAGKYVTGYVSVDNFREV